LLVGSELLISDDFTLKMLPKSSFICHNWNIKKLAQASPGKGRKSQFSQAKTPIFSQLKVIIFFKFLKIFNKIVSNVYLELYYHIYYRFKYFLEHFLNIFKKLILGPKNDKKNHHLKYFNNILNLNLLKNNLNDHVSSKTSIKSDFDQFSKDL